ncbi:MAG: cupin domain-containing protein [Gammaproteobacteria bacterium]
MNTRRIAGAFALLAIPLVSISLISISSGASPSADEPLPMQRLTPAEIASMAAARPPGGVQMTNLIGDPTRPGLYTVRVAIAPHTQAKPDTHRDNRTVTVLSGTWHMGYGTQLDVKALKDLPPGSVYSEPAGQPHFAQTGDEAVVILVTGYGPSDTQFVTH